MLTTTTLMLQGLAFQPDYPADFIELGSESALHWVERNQAGCTYKTPVPSRHSFYVVVPACPLLEGVFLPATGITIYYSTFDSAINNIRVFDGSTLLADFSNLNWSGNHHAGDYDPQFNARNFPAPAVISRGGITVWVDVDMQPTFNNPQMEYSFVSFSSISIHFTTGQSWAVKLVTWIASIFKN